LVAATSGGIVLVDEPDGHLVYLDLLTAELTGRKRTNDGKVGPDGAFWFGTMRDGSSTAVGGLFRTDSNGVTTPHLKELHIPNGLDWTRDARHMFHIDTRTSLLTRYPFHGDCLGVPDQEIDLSAYEGSPDGMTIDSDGNLWICFWKGWAIRKISPDGELLLEIPMPVSNPTSCTFGGDDMSKLFISTASYGLTDSQLAQEPFAGSIFTLSTTSTGIRANLFG
jgi:sugar lactone lactonase YvrE